MDFCEFLKLECITQLCKKQSRKKPKKKVKKDSAYYMNKYKD